MKSFLYKTDVTWSMLNDGFAIPVLFQDEFFADLGFRLSKGHSETIKVMLAGKYYEAKLMNLGFNEKKWPEHKEIVQIRYNPNSEISIALRSVFSETYHQMKKIKTGLKPKQHLRVPDDIKAELAVFGGIKQGELVFDAIPCKMRNEAREKISLQTEEEFEAGQLIKATDEDAKVVEREAKIKVRVLDREIGEALKRLYKNQCQICKYGFLDRYGVALSEAHHIDPFVKSLNNNAENILILCPNHHRVIHKSHPKYDMKRSVYLFNNGLEEKILF